MKTSVYCLIILFLSSLNIVGAAEFKLNRFFSNNMVLQREKPVTITGEGEPGEAVTVTFAGQNKEGKVAKNGTWSVVLDPMQPSAEGHELKCVSAGKNITISNILIGDVFMFARQTRVDVSLGKTEEGQSAANAYKSSGNFRAITIKTIPSKKLLNDLPAGATKGWFDVNSKNALAMSAAAFYLGSDLEKGLKIPVGIVDVNMGYYYAVGWMSEKAITESQTLHPKDKTIPWLPEWMHKLVEERDSGREKAELDKEYEAKVEKWGEKRAGKKPSLGLHPLKFPMFPSVGYNSVLHPLRNIAMKGVILQLGNDYPFIAYMAVMEAGKGTDNIELNQAWGQNYWIMKHGYRVTPVTLPYIPEDWRRTLGDKDLPIGLVLPPSSDLHPYAIHNREIREMHRRTSENNKGIGLIMPGMKNIPFSGQPKDEKLLAERCKLWVLGDVEGKKDVDFTGPVFDRMEADLSEATIYFKKGTADGLKASEEALKLFEAAGPDGKFYPAEAKLNGETIEIKCEKAGQIEFVRFNWIADPDMGLVNKAGLPALPFNSNPNWKFAWIPPSPELKLPEEYSTTADKWSKSDVAIINGKIANMATGDSEPIPRRPGPLGIYSAPFGPNIFVISIDPGTPAVGRLQPGDVIYGVNGKVFEGDIYRQLADAITYSESEEGKGKLMLKVRRGTKLMDVELQLQVLGSYSSTSPYFCKKSRNIVLNAEKWISNKYRPEKGLASMPTGMLNTDLLFLLASGNPEHLGLVRRVVYEMISKPIKEAVPGGRAKPWTTGYNALLIGEYYHSTGDPNVLPYLKNLSDWAAVSQLKPADETPKNVEAAQTEEQVGGYRQNYPSAPDRWKSGYGLMPHAGMTCVMGMLYAKEAGLEVDELALKRGLKHFHDGRAEVGFVLYSYSNLKRDKPQTINPEAEANGKLWSMNGKLGTAAALFSMVDDYKSVDACARHCVYGYNNTRHGHGGMFFNNFWTPIGANLAGENAFKHFMQGQRWWRELFRRSDGSFNQVGRGHIGVSYALPYAAPEKRLRMLGAPKSVFGGNAPEYLKPAIEAHQKRDYALAEKLMNKVMEETTIPAADLPKVKQFLRLVQTVKQSVDYDLAYTQKLIDDGKYYYASIELPQLKGVVAEDDPRLKKIVAALESSEGKAKIQKSKKVAENESGELKEKQKTANAGNKKEKWTTIPTLAAGTDNEKPGKLWRMKVVEDVSQADKDWTQLNFNDSTWDIAELPLSWMMYHTALFRGEFNIQDKSKIEKLRFLGKFFQQNNVLIYINGHLVAKVDEIGRGTGNTEGQLTDYALELLKNGRNIIAFSSRHKRRWGPMRGKYTTAAKVDFKLEAKIK